MSHARDSFETLDLDTLEASDELDEESGSRRVEDEAPRGVWSDAPPRPVVRSGVLPPPPPPGLLPPPLPRGFARAKMAPVPPIDERVHAVSTADAPVLDAPEPDEPVTEVDRVDLDDVVRDLATRPAETRAAAWELPSAPMTPSALEARPHLDAPKRRIPAWAWALGSIATYLLGLATPSLLGWTARPESAESASIEVAAQPVDPSPALDQTTPSAGDAPTAIAEEPTTDVAHEPTASASHVGTAARPRAAHARTADGTRERRDEAEQAAPIEAAAREPAVEADEPASAEPAIEVPTRDDVQHAMASVQPTIEACATAADRGQLARVRFTFTSEGRPSHTIVAGVAGQTASCIARAARGVRLPAFARDSFVVEFPFQL